MTDSSAFALPFSRLVTLKSLGGKERAYNIEASSDERRALSVLLKILGLQSLTASIVLTPGEKGQLCLAGEVTAHPIQTCVLTLEPVASTIESKIDRLFTSEPEKFAPQEGEIEKAVSPSLLPGGIIDLGEVAAEQLALDLDPFPRTPGAVFKGYSTDNFIGEEDNKGRNSFAALAALKEK